MATAWQPGGRLSPADVTAKSAPNPLGMAHLPAGCGARFACLEGMPMTAQGNWVTSARARTALGARKSRSVLAAAAVAAGLTVAGAAPAGAAAAHHHHAAARSGPAGDETTVSQNDLRDGWDPNEPTLTPAALSGGHFGQIFKTSVNGQVYAQPLIV